MHLAQRPGRKGLRVESIEGVFEGAPLLLLDDRPNLLKRNRWDSIGQGVERLGVFVRKEVGATGKELAELHEAGAQFGNRLEELIGSASVKRRRSVSGGAPEKPATAIAED